jgi:excisionase family DNA binding protein
VPKAAGAIRVYSVTEVANICGAVNQIVINWIRNGHLRAFSTPGGQYRVRGEDLADFLARHGMRGSIAALHLAEKNSGGAGAKTEAAGVKTETALIIDHDQNFNNQLKSWLEDLLPGHRILQARDGFEAGWLFRPCTPDLVFLNVDLPGVNIHNMARKFKEGPCPRYPRVIALVPGKAGGTGTAGAGKTGDTASGDPGDMLPWADACFPRRLDDEARNIILRQAPRTSVKAPS